MSATRAAGILALALSALVALQHARAPATTVPLPPPEREMRLLIVPARFADSPDAPVTREELQREFCDGPSLRGTLPDYYREASAGRLALTCLVTDWVQTALPSTDWRGLGTEFLNNRMEQAAAAIRAVDPGIDFGHYDNDGPDGIPNSGDDDGVVDAGVALLWAERMSVCDGSALHPEALRFANPAREETPVVTDDLSPTGQPILVRRASFSSAVTCAGTLAGIAITAHELGHQMFGLPDVYSQQGVFLPDFQLDRLNGRRWVLGCWDIMAAGSGWGCGTGPSTHDRSPTLHSPVARETLGWLEPLLVPEVRDAEYILRPPSLGGVVLRVPVRAGDLGEFFQIEYRQRIGFDQALPASGVLIYSVDTAAGFGSTCSGACRSYREQLIEADGRSDLLLTGLEGGNRGEASDAFAHGPDAPRRFAANTVPASRARDGSLTTLTIHDIRIDEAAGTATVRLSTAPTPALIRLDGMDTAISALASLSAVVRAAGGALPYAWTVTGLPSGVELSVFTGTDSVALTGSATESGAFSPQVRAQDALGTQVQTTASWQVGARAIDPAAMLRHLLRGGNAADLSSGEAEYLDRMGNRNGRFDVGDARAERRRGASAAGSSRRPEDRSLAPSTEAETDLQSLRSD